MILNTEVPFASTERESQPSGIKCDLAKVEACEFIKWCRRHLADVSEPFWFAMITNLAYLEGGPALIHDISRLDMFSYDYQPTQRLIERVLDKEYSAVSCEGLKSLGFQCSKLEHCNVKAPKYLTDLFSIWSR